MSKSVSYSWTKVACYLGYITQAISINLLPLLYVTFQNRFGVSLQQIGAMATVIFFVQLCVDAVAARVGRYLSYRVGCVAAHVFATVGLVSMSFLPNWLPDPYVGVLISAILLAVGGGLTEVLISPVIDAMPGDKKTGAMSLLHSFYCWGVVAVVLLSTLFFALLGTHQWALLPLCWAVIPAMTTVLFVMVPLPSKPEESESGEGMTLRRLLGSGTVWLLLALMVFSGASEMAPGQWASLFAEEGLGISKTLGDLLGPCAFAFLQGIARLAFAPLAHRFDSVRVLALCGAGCVVGYLFVVVSPWPAVSLFGFCLAGLAVGPMWPGVLSISAARYPTGGTTMFALLALCGDIGCSLAPGLVGSVSDSLQGSGFSLIASLRGGFGVCTLFPVLLLIGFSILSGRRRSSRWFA